MNYSFTKVLLCFLISLFFISVSNLSAQEKDKKLKLKIDRRIDNMNYWMQLAEKGLIPYNPAVKAPPAVYKGSKINASVVKNDFDSPDVTSHDADDHTQSEISIAANPNDGTHIINSNNSTTWSGTTVGSLYGTSSFFSDDAAQTWYGTEEATGGGNSGDPAAAIDLNGRMYSGFIHSNGGQGVAYSDNGGTTWTSVLVASSSSWDGLLDKNHLIVDATPGSPYAGNVYTAWTNLDEGSNYSEIEFAYSDDGGLNYSTPVEISSGVNAGSHSQGINLQTGPNGEVFAVWSIYDDFSGVGYEEALGFNVSYDGGETWGTAVRIIEDIRGIRNFQPTAHRVNSFPSMAVDKQTGDIYIVWSNRGEPGVNTGNNISVYMIKSTDGGSTWSQPARVNQNPPDDDEASYLPWMSCDPSSGNLAVVFYDTRNTSGDDVEAWTAVSLDGGETWEDFRVSDVSFTTQAIPGLAAEYMGDYLGIAVQDDMVYPAWSDNRDGIFKAYISPFILNTLPRPQELIAAITNESTGETELNWTYTETEAPSYFIVYRDGAQIATTNETNYTDNLPDYGHYRYSVSAMHADGESAKIYDEITWGAAHISVNPTSLSESLYINQTSTKQLTISNPGELDLTYNLQTQITNRTANREYCAASGGGDEYINRVIFGSIDNTSSETSYGDYTAQTTELASGDSEELSIHVTNPYDVDDLGVWVDWNQDGDFDDTNENPVCESSIGTSGVYTYSISPPASATAGQTRMRIRLKYTGSDCGSPCGATSWGEVEDYGIIVNNWINVGGTGGTVSPGSSEIIDVEFTSFDIEPGTYNANIKINSNAETDNELVVPVSLTVLGQLMVSPTASPQIICPGESTQLFANAGGGSGTYTYSWTSDDGTFSSDEADPIVSPTTNTEYYIEVNDGQNSISGQVSVQIMPEPGEATVPVGPTSVSAGDAELYGTSEQPNAENYLWELSPSSAGQISGSGTEILLTFATDFEGEALLTVKAVNACYEDTPFSDALSINVEEATIIKDNNARTFWRFYPNPNSGDLIVELDAPKHDLVSLEIFDLSGKKVYELYNWSVWANNSKLLKLSHLQKGLYLVKMSGKNFSKTKKLIIK